MNRTTDEAARMREALGGRVVGLYDRMPAHTPRDAVLEATQAARAADADLIVTFGGGSVTDAGNMVRLCLQNDINDFDGFDTLIAKLGQSRRLYSLLAVPDSGRKIKS